MGQSSNVLAIATAAVLGLVALGILLPVGINVATQIYAVTNATNMSAQGRTAFDATFNGIWGGFQLFSISPTILAAGGIITLLIVSFVWYQGRQQ